MKGLKRSSLRIKKSIKEKKNIKESLTFEINDNPFLYFL